MERRLLHSDIYHKSLRLKIQELQGCSMIDSSIHTTGRNGSYGRLYTSRTNSICATKSPLCSGGITHCSFCHGFNSFFLKPCAQFHAIQNQYIPIPRFCPQVAAKTNAHALLVANCKKAQSNELPHLRLFF